MKEALALTVLAAVVIVTALLDRLNLYKRALRQLEFEESAPQEFDADRTHAAMLAWEEQMERIANSNRASIWAYRYAKSQRDKSYALLVANRPL